MKSVQLHLVTLRNAAMNYHLMLEQISSLYFKMEEDGNVYYHLLYIPRM